MIKMRLKKNQFTLIEVIIAIFVLSAAMFTIITLLPAGMYNIEKARNQRDIAYTTDLTQSYTRAYLQDSSVWEDLQQGLWSDYPTNTVENSPKTGLTHIPYAELSISENSSNAEIITAIEGASVNSDWTIATQKNEDKEGSANDVYTSSDGKNNISSLSNGLHSVRFRTETNKGTLDHHVGLALWFDSSGTIYTSVGTLIASDFSTFTKVNYLITWPLTMSLKQRITEGNYSYGYFIINGAQ